RRRRKFNAAHRVPAVLQGRERPHCSETPFGLIWGSRIPVNSRFPMKKIPSPLAIVLAGVFALAALPAWAGHDEEEGDPLFDRLDANGDGHLTRAENAAGARKLFAAMDADRDGFVTAAEMDAYRGQRKDAAIRFSPAVPAGDGGSDPGSGAARA